MKRVIITGSSGFIGRHLVRYILDNTDWEIVALDRQEAWPVDFNSRIHTVIANLRDPYLKNVLDKEIFDFDYVIHLAAEKDVRASFLDVTPYILTNIQGTVNLLEWLKGKIFERMINFSTAAVLGPETNSEGIKISICPHPILTQYSPHNPYAGTKACQEVMCETYRATFGVPIVNVRIDTPFGEGQPPGNFIPFVIGKLVYGQEIPLYSKILPNGALQYSYRNWIHCQEVSEYLVRILRREVDATVNYKSTIYHLGGESHTVLDMLALITDSLGIMQGTYSVKNVELDPLSKIMDAQIGYGLGSHPIVIYHALVPGLFNQRVAQTARWFFEKFNREKMPNQGRILT